MDLKSIALWVVSLVAAVGGPSAALYGIRQSKRMEALKLQVDTAFRSREERRDEEDSARQTSDWWERQCGALRIEVGRQAARVAELEAAVETQRKHIATQDATIRDLQSRLWQLDQKGKLT